RWLVTDRDSGTEGHYHPAQLNELGITGQVTGLAAAIKKHLLTALREHRQAWAQGHPVFGFPYGDATQLVQAFGESLGEGPRYVLNQQQGRREIGRQLSQDFLQRHRTTGGGADRHQFVAALARCGATAGWLCRRLSRR